MVIDKNLTPFKKEFRDASRLLNGIPVKHKGLNEDIEKDLDKVGRMVDRLGDDLARQGVDTSKLNDAARQALYVAGAKASGLPESAGQLAYTLRPGSKGDKKLRDPKFDAFLIANEDELRRFFPTLYSREILQEAFEVAR